MKSVLSLIRRVHADEQGAEGAEKLLIIAAIALPLLGLLIYFRDWIKDWVGGEANTVKGDATNFQSQF